MAKDKAVEITQEIFDYCNFTTADITDLEATDRFIDVEVSFKTCDYPCFKTKKECVFGICVNIPYPTTCNGKSILCGFEKIKVQASKWLKQAIATANNILKIKETVDKCKDAFGRIESNINNAISSALNGFADGKPVTAGVANSMELTLRTYFGVYDDLLSCAGAIMGFNAMSLSVGVSGNARGDAASIEAGAAKQFGTNNKDFMAFWGHCYGAATTPSVGGDVIVGFWRQLSDIPGTSWTIGIDVDIPAFGSKAGGSLDMVFNDAIELLGVVFSLGVGLGGSPVDFHGFRCETYADTYPLQSCAPGRSDWSCCTSSSPCGLFEGDCDKHSQCSGSLICGENNCEKVSGENSFDCCVEPDWYKCTSTNKCKTGDGDCDGGHECESGQCGKDNCGPDFPDKFDCCL